MNDNFGSLSIHIMPIDLSTTVRGSRILLGCEIHSQTINVQRSICRNLEVK